MSDDPGIPDYDLPPEPMRFSEEYVRRLEAQVANMRGLLVDLRHSRPLMLYGQPWVADIENVLAGHPYEPMFREDGP